MVRFARKENMNHLKNEVFNKESKMKKILLILFLIHSGNVFSYPSYYDILGVNPSSSQEEINKAYKRLSMKYHPDRNPSKNANEVMAQINLAYETLKDPNKRSTYDRYYREFQRDQSEWNAGYQFNYSSNFFYQYETSDNFEERELKEVWNALKVLEWHSPFVSFEDLRTSWDVIQDTYKKLQWMEHYNPTIFNDINKSYQILHKFYNPVHNPQKQNYYYDDWDERRGKRKGLWVLIAVILLLKAMDGRAMETVQTEFMEKPAIVEYEDQEIPLKKRDCSFVFTK